MDHPNWKYRCGGHEERGAQRLYRDDVLGVQKEVYARRRANGEWLRGKAYYFIDGLDLEFTDEADMMEHLEAHKQKKISVLKPLADHE